MRGLKFIVCAAAAVGCFSISAAAGPVASAGVSVKGDVTQAGSELVQKVHGCHRDVQLGGAGWHRHVGINCVRVAAHPPRPRCWRDCNYVGPIKVCKTKCR
jgi:hypothetical protein